MTDVLSYIDLLVCLGIFGLTLLYLFTIGKDFSVTICLGLFMALATMEFVPFLHELHISVAGVPYWLVKTMILFVFTVVFSYLQTHNGFFEPVVVPSKWEVPFFALAFSGMFIVAVTRFMPGSVISDLSPTFWMLFVEEPIADVWFLTIPLLLLFLRGKA